MPYVIEVAFGYREDDENPAEDRRGLRLHPGHRRLAVQALGAAGRPRSTPTTRSPVRPCGRPRLAFLDRGKARVELPRKVADKLNELVNSVTASGPSRSGPRYATPTRRRGAPKGWPSATSR